MDFSNINKRDKNWWQHYYSERVGFLIIPHSSIAAVSALVTEINTAQSFGVKVFAWDNNTVIPIYQSKITQAHLSLALQSGGDVYDLPVWIEVDSLESVVPAELFGSTIIDEDEVEQTQTWEEWLKDTDALVRDGRTFIPSHANTNKTPSISELAPVIGSVVLANELPDPETTQ